MVEVTFSWKDYRQNCKAKVMTFDVDEFMRRFLLHTLPNGFHRIRQYGFLANEDATISPPSAVKLLAVRNAPAGQEAVGDPLLKCEIPVCSHATALDVVPRAGARDHLLRCDTS